MDFLFMNHEYFLKEFQKQVDMKIVKNSSYSNDTLKVDLDLSMYMPKVLKELKSLEGKVKDTEFNRVEITNLSIRLLDERAIVTGKWKAEHRERVFYNIFAGHPVHSSWIGIRGGFEQDFLLSITNGVLNVVPTKNKISVSNLPPFIADLLVRWTNANGALRNAIKNGLGDFNGKSLTRTLMLFKGEIAQKSGLSVQQVEKIINATTTLNVTLKGSLIQVSIVVPKDVIAIPWQKVPPSIAESKPTRAFTRTNLIKTQFRFLMAETVNLSQEDMKKYLDDGIDDKWLGEVMVYAIDSTNKCLGQISLQIDWDRHKQEMRVTEKVQIDKPWRGENNDISNGVSVVVSVFKDFGERNALRLIWQFEYTPGVDRAAMNKKLGVKDTQPSQWKTSPHGEKQALTKLPELTIGYYYAG